MIRAPKAALFMSDFVSPDQASVGLRYAMVSDFGYDRGNLGYLAFPHGLGLLDATFQF